MAFLCCLFFAPAAHADPVPSKVQGWGDSAGAALGNGSSSTRTTPSPACAPGATECYSAPLNDVRAIAVGNYHALALLNNGTVVGWGANYGGRLGDGTTVNRTTPVPVCAVGATDCAATPLSGVTAISTTGYHNLALLTDGTVVAWGSNDSGQLGDGTTTGRSTPVRVCAPGATDCAANPLTGITQIMAGSGHSLALRSGQTVVSWGRNWDGQLGDNSTTDRTTPVPVCAIGATDCTTTPLSGVAQLTAGGAQSVARLADGHVVAWGDNAVGDLGDGTRTDRVTPVSVCATGATDCTANPLSGIKSVDSGNMTTLAITDAGAAVGWGGNYSGELGDGTREIRSTPVQLPLTGVASLTVGFDHANAVLTNGSTLAWGENAQGELGDGSLTDRFAPVPVCALEITGCDGTFLTGLTAVKAGLAFTVGLRQDGTVLTWGTGGIGQLSDNGSWSRTTPANVCALGESDCTANPLRAARKIAPGMSHTLALLENGTVASWGSNQFGNLGNNTTINRSRPVQVCAVGATDCGAHPLQGVASVSAGGNHSLALLTDGTVVSWGYNVGGELGDGTTATRTTPVKVCAPGATDCAANPLTGVVKVAAGNGISLAVLSNGTLVSWGTNEDGRLGDGKKADKRTTPGKVCAPGATDCEAAPLTGVTDVAAYSHVLALLSNGTVAAWGSNQSGQLGKDWQHADQYRPSVVCATGGCGSSLTGVTAIDAGFQHSVAVVNGTAFSWGTNWAGQLGDGTFTGRSLPGPVCAVGATDCAAGPLTGVTALSSSKSEHVLAITGGVVVGWGKNDRGQVGDGTLDNRGQPVRVCETGATDCAANPVTGAVSVHAGFWTSHAVR